LDFFVTSVAEVHGGTDDEVRLAGDAVNSPSATQTDDPSEFRTGKENEARNKDFLKL
jgi:hypothetical protein